MSDTWKTVLISIFTSIVVSLFTYVLGLKTGKNQSDRAMIQGIYKKIYAHFDNLCEKIQQNRPLTWENFKAVKIDANRIKYMPIVAELKSDGDLLYITESLAEKSLDLEKCLMDYGWNRIHSLEHIHDVLCKANDLYIEGYKTAGYPGYRKNTHFETANPTKCNTYIPVSYQEWFDRERIKQLFQRAGNDKAIEFRRQTDGETFSIKIFPNSLNVSVDEYIQEIYQRLDKEVDGFKKVCEEKEKLLEQVDNLKKDIAKKAREPFSFWGTFLGAFADIFR